MSQRKTKAQGEGEVIGEGEETQEGEDTENTNNVLESLPPASGEEAPCNKQQEGRCLCRRTCRICRKGNDEGRTCRSRRRNTGSRCRRIP